MSLFYGEEIFKETIKIATLCGWDSDNPASTWEWLPVLCMEKTNSKNVQY